MRALVYSPIPWNGVKTETFSPQSDCATELNVNFLTATVHVLLSGKFLRGSIVFADAHNHAHSSCF